MRNSLGAGVIRMPEIDCSHPYWGQSVQCRERQAKQQQQKTQGKPEAKPQQKPRPQGRPRERESFDDELANRRVKIVLLGNGNAEEISGTIVDISRYWLKVLDDNGTVKYINKAFIVSIIPE
jgi:hypothetical protein